MAETAAQSNNVAVKYRGKPRREMPSKSQAQNRFMHAVAEGEVQGVPPSVGKEFVKADEGRKIGKLPKRVKRKARHAVKHGMISEAAAKKHLSS